MIFFQNKFIDISGNYFQTPALLRQLMDTNLAHGTQGEPVNVSIPEMFEARLKKAAHRLGLSEKEFATLLLQKGFSILETLDESYPR